MKPNSRGIWGVLKADQPERTAVLLAGSGFAVLTAISAAQVVLAAQVDRSLVFWAGIAYGTARWLGWAALAPLIVLLAGLIFPTTAASSRLRSTAFRPWLATSRSSRS
jgi:hypothetical protein